MHKPHWHQNLASKPRPTVEPPMPSYSWIESYNLKLMAKHNIVTEDYERKFTPAQIASLSDEVNGKNQLERESKASSQLYFSLLLYGQKIFYICHPQPTVSR